MSKKLPAAKAATGQQPLSRIPTPDPAAFIVWETRTVKCGTKNAPKTWEFYQTTCKGHSFRVGRLPHELPCQWPPRPWKNARWQMLAELELGQNLEFISSLPGCETKDEALALAAQRIACFIEEKKHYQ